MSYSFIVTLFVLFLINANQFAYGIVGKGRADILEKRS